MDVRVPKTEKKAATQQPIYEALDRVGNDIAQLEDAVTQLNTKVNAVMSPSQPSETVDKPGPDDPGNSDVCQIICNLSRTLQIQIGRIRALRDNSEV